MTINAPIENIHRQWGIIMQKGTHKAKSIICHGGLLIQGIRVIVFNAKYYQQYFSYIVAVGFIGEGNRSTRRKPPICHKSLTNWQSKSFYILWAMQDYVSLLILLLFNFFNFFNCFLCFVFVYTIHLYCRLKAFLFGTLLTVANVFHINKLP